MATIDGKTFKNIPLMGVTGGDIYTNCSFRNVGFTGSLSIGPGCNLRNVRGDIESLTMTSGTCKMDNARIKTGVLSQNGALMTQTHVTAKLSAVGSLSYSSEGLPPGSSGSRMMYVPGQVAIDSTSGEHLVLSYPSALTAPETVVGYGCSVPLGAVGTNGTQMHMLGGVFSSGDTGILSIGYTGGTAWATYVSDGSTTITGGYLGTTGQVSMPMEASGLLSIIMPGNISAGCTGEIVAVCKGKVPWGALTFGATGLGNSFTILSTGSTGVGLTGGTTTISRNFTAGLSGVSYLSASCSLGSKKIWSASMGYTGFMPGYAVFEVNVTAGQSVTLQSIKTGGETRVLWGDGTMVSGSSSSYSRVYPKAGTYMLQTDATSSGTGNQLFPNNSYLRKVHMWGNLLKGVWNGDRLLLGSTALVSLPPTWAGLESVGSLYYAFQGCASLCVLPSSWVGLSSLTSAFGAFESSGITVLPSSWRGLENVTTTRAMFYNCTQLLSAPSSWEGLEKNTNTWDMFYNNVRLQTPITSWAGLGLVNTAINMFYNTAIPSIPDSWSGLTSLSNASEMFRNCSSLVTGGTADIGTLSKVTNCYMMMDGCSSYKGNVLNLYNTLRNRCTSTDYYRYAFRGCSSAVGYADLSYYWKN